VVINSLVLSLPAIGNVVLVCMVFWLIFSIMGYQFFGGKFYKCIDKDRNIYNATFIPDKITCLANATINGNRWINSKIHFNSAFTGFLALFQVVSFYINLFYRNVCEIFSLNHSLYIFRIVGLTHTTDRPSTHVNISQDVFATSL
jgi:hypothetical protein